MRGLDPVIRTSTPSLSADTRQKEEEEKKVSSTPPRVGGVAQGRRV